jgi:hypothetical protein
MNGCFSDGECRCACHTDPGVLHIMPCCDKPRATDPRYEAELCDCDDPGGPNCKYPGAGR